MQVQHLQRINWKSEVIILIKLVKTSLYLDTKGHEIQMTEIRIRLGEWMDRSQSSTHVSETKSVNESIKRTSIMASKP